MGKPFQKLSQLTSTQELPGTETDSGTQLTKNNNQEEVEQSIRRLKNWKTPATPIYERK